MGELFPDYFTPTEQEFAELWRNATIELAANVLLGLYRLASESRQLFFDVLQSLPGRSLDARTSACKNSKDRMVGRNP